MNYNNFNAFMQMLTVGLALVTIFYSHKNLREMKKQLNEQQQQNFEHNRGTLLFYIVKADVNQMHTLVLRNFGNSPTKLLSFSINPGLDWNWNKPDNSIPNLNFSNINNLFLAPNQYISSLFNFTDYKDKEFEVTIKYVTLHKEFTEKYTINIEYIKNIVYTLPNTSNEKESLESIAKSLDILSKNSLF